MYVLLLIGVFACSTAVLFIKLSALDPVLLAALRTLLAAVVLSPLFIAAQRRHRETFHWKELRRCLLPAAMLALHFISWNYGARMTTAANASLLVNLVPLAMPFLLFFLAHERVTGNEWAGTGIAMIGVVMMTAGDFVADPRYLAGNLVCLASMVFFATYLAFGRSNRAFPQLWLYVVPVYAFTGVICMAIALAAGNPPVAIPLREWGLVLCLVLIPTMVGHTLLNRALKHLRGQVVSIVNLWQFFFAGVMAYLLFGEVPGPTFYPGCACILFGAWWATMRRQRLA